MNRRTFKTALLLAVCMGCGAVPALAQLQTIQVHITDAETHKPLENAEVSPSINVQIRYTDAAGNTTLYGMSSGRTVISLYHNDYWPDSVVVTVPVSGDTLWLTMRKRPKPPMDDIGFISQDDAEQPVGPVVVSSTRNYNLLTHEPQKVNYIDPEEVEEKTLMRPGNVTMMLTEQPGIQPQQSSAATGNINIRMQGLPGQYTQVLKDGLPLYSGFSSVLGLMQLSPLDIDHVEIIRGPASVLFGGDAIAGAINIITKRPEHNECTLLLNRTSLQGTDISGWYSKYNGHVGASVLASANLQNAMDIDKDGVADLPMVRQYSIMPRLSFDIDDDTWLVLGISSLYDERVGGSVANIASSSYSFQTFNEADQSMRTYTQALFTRRFAHGNLLSIKNSFNFFDRSLTGYHNFFKGSQTASYTEASYLAHLGRNSLVLGADLRTDTFTETKPDTLPAAPQVRSYSYRTIGFFVQDEWRITDRFSAEAGVRVDYHNVFGAFYLPKLNLFYQLNRNFFARLGGGYGYKIPTVFTDQSERLAYWFVNPIDPKTVKPETSRGANLDLDYKIWLRGWVNTFTDISVSVFYTSINNPVIPVNTDHIHWNYVNAGNDITAKGFSLKAVYTGTQLYAAAAYTYTDAERLFDTINTQQALTARHLVNLNAGFEDHKHWKAGLEAYYIGSQITDDYSRKPGYWLLGALVSYHINNFTFTLNAENLLDIRQTKYEPLVYNPNPPGPGPIQYRDIWAPLDGRVVNLSVKVKI